MCVRVLTTSSDLIAGERSVLCMVASLEQGSIDNREVRWLVSCGAVVCCTRWCVVFARQKEQLSLPPHSVENVWVWGEISRGSTLQTP